MLGLVTVSSDTLTDLVRRTADKYGIEPALVKAVIQQESNWDVNASRYEAKINDSSWGLMQVLVSTARSVLGEPSLTISQLIQPETNIEAGTKYLSQLIGKYGNIADAVSAYNLGSVKRTASGNYVNNGYVQSVLGWYGVYQAKDQLAQAGSEAVESIRSGVQNIVPVGALSDPVYWLFGIAGVAGIGLLLANR